MMIEGDMLAEAANTVGSKLKQFPLLSTTSNFCPLQNALPSL